MKKILIMGIAAAAFCGAPALAADMPVKAPVYKAPPPVFTWTGCYIGGNLGGGWKHVRSTDDPGGGLEFNHTFDGLVGGGQIGCDYQVNNNWVVGVQGMWDASGVGGTTHDLIFPADTINVKARSFGTVAAELGYLINPTTKIYGKVGYGWVREKDTYNCSTVDCDIAESSSISERRGGLDAGGGLTWMFQPNLGLFIEYDCIVLNSKNATFNFPVNDFTIPVANKERFSTILIGVIFRNAEAVNN